MRTTRTTHWLARTVAAVAAVVLALTGPAALAQPVAPAPVPAEARENQALAEFAGCMAGAGGANLLIVMDQSGSLVEDIGDNPATDPEHRRVDAAQDFVSELARYGEEAGADIRVRTAGFGETYYADESEYGGWNSLTDGVGPVHQELEKFRDRTDDGYTQYPDALSGALATSGTEDSPCQAVMLFTDGMMTMAGQDTDAAAQQMCAAGGPVDQLRSAGIQIFSVGLSDGGSQDMSLLQDISESTDDCGGGTSANGQFVEGASAAGLMAAFRSAIPNPAGHSQDNIQVNEFFSFYLDNSVSPVRLAAQPETTVEDGELTPVLTPPNGEPVELEPGEQQIGGALVTTEFHDTVPGVVDVDMQLADDWAGEWAFGYLSSTAEDASYRAQLTIHPGMSLQVGAESNEAGTSLSSVNTSPIAVQLIDSEGNPQSLDGQALLSAEFETPDQGTVELLSDAPIGAGDPVEIPLEQITQPTSGMLTLRVDIATAGPEGVPGTSLEPLMFEAPLSVTLETLPQLPGTIDVGQITEETVAASVPVTGPGRVWVEPMELADANVPAGSTVTVDSSADSVDSAITLERGETADLPLTVTTGDLADGPVSGTVTLHYSDLDGNDQGTTSVPVRGAMSVPVDATAFTAAFVVVLLLALLIPLGVLYLMKFLAGRIPGSPRVYTLRLPVADENNQLLRTDSGQRFDVSYRELSSQPAVELAPRRANVRGTDLNVTLGWNPLDPAYVEVDAPLSIADDGGRSGTSAKLPVAVHNHWFMTMNPQRPDDASVVLIVDETSQGDALSAMVAQIRSKGPDHLHRLREDLDSGAVQTEGPAGGHPAAPGGAGVAGDPVEGAQPTQFGQFGAPGGFGSQPGSQQGGQFGGHFGPPNSFGEGGRFGEGPSGPQSGGFGRPGGH